MNRPWTRYSESVCDLAKRYGVTGRTIKRWSALGRKASDSPPMSAPDKMPDWWSRIQPSRKIPGHILAAAALAREEGKLQGSDPAPNDANDANSNINIDPKTLAGFTPREAEQSLSRQLQAADMRLNNAMEGKGGSVEAARQNYDRIAEVHRKAYATLQDFEKSRGDLIDKKDAAAEIARFAEVLKGMHEAMPGKIEAYLRDHGHRPTPRVLRLLGIELRAAIESVRDQELKIFRKLSAS